MARMVGADVAELRGLAAQFDQAAQRFEALTAQVGHGVHVSAWAGPVAVRFRLDWDSAHSVSVRSAAHALNAQANALRAQAQQQEATSATLADGAGSRVVGSMPPTLRGVLAAGERLFALGSGVLGFGEALGATAEASKGRFADLVERLPHGGAYGTALSGIGLGFAAGGIYEGYHEGDGAKFVGSAFDAGVTFASAPVSLLWSGLKAEAGFFVPLDGEAADADYEWMKSRGYSDSELAARYEGVNGFVTWGNDHVERHSPWLNDAADAVMAKPAEFLYNLGIRVG